MCIQIVKFRHLYFLLEVYFLKNVLSNSICTAGLLFREGKSYGTCVNITLLMLNGLWVQVFHKNEI